MNGVNQGNDATCIIKHFLIMQKKMYTNNSLLILLLCAENNNSNTACAIIALDRDRACTNHVCTFDDHYILLIIFTTAAITVCAE